MDNYTQEWRSAKRVVIYMVLLLGVLTCSYPDDDLDKDVRTEPCVTTSTNVGVYLRCPGQEQVFIPNGTPGQEGIQGPSGPQGQIGTPGKDGLESKPGKDGKDGQDGATGAVGPIGPEGQKGDTGTQGVQGIKGDTGAAGPQGLPGEAGKAGQNAVVEVYDPCGDSPGFDEVILKLADGTLMSYFESGSNRFLTILRPGTYRTTDGSNCIFTIRSDGSIQ
jgi:hypothetical protein